MGVPVLCWLLLARSVRSIPGCWSRVVCLRVGESMYTNEDRIVDIIGAIAWTGILLLMFAI